LSTFYLDQPVERELKRLKTDPNEDPKRSIPSAADKPLVEDSPAAVIPNNCQDGTLNDIADTLINSSDDINHDQKTLVKSELDKIVEYPTESKPFNVYLKYRILSN
jgi:hypothetical protein